MRSLLVPLAALVFTLAMTAWRFTPPSVVAPGGSAFSAEAALTHLDGLLDGRAHPIGSRAQHDLRSRLVGKLDGLGLEPEVQRASVCSPLGSCGTVENVVVTLPGSRDSAVLLSVHTDSAWLGEGAADDGAAVGSAIELARLWRDRPHQNTLIFLFEEGEEEGLLGALAFAREHPEAATVGAAINLEARGRTGITQLYQTTRNNGWLVSAWGSQASLPFATSISDEVYALMPHHSDLDVWAAWGIPSLNFAFLEGSAHYHTARDTREHLDPRAVQGLGEAADAALWALADVDLDHAATTDAHFFDLLGLAVLHWPAVASLRAALVLLLTGGLALAVAWRRRGTDQKLGWRSWTAWFALAAVGAAIALRVPGAAYLFLAPCAVWLATRMIRPELSGRAALVSAMPLWIPILWAVSIAFPADAPAVHNIVHTEGPDGVFLVQSGIFEASEPAESTSLPRPSLQLARGRKHMDRWRFQGVLHLPAGSLDGELRLAEAAGVKGVRINGAAVPRSVLRGDVSVSLHGRQHYDVEIELTDPMAPWRLQARFPGLPDAERPAKTVEFHDGDHRVSWLTITPGSAPVAMRSKP